MNSNQQAKGGLSNSHIKVLVADDDSPTRMLLRAVISQWGYEVAEAGDGEEAWNLLQSPDSPRLLLIDWLMPRIDGPTLCMRIKEEAKKRPYIILLTQVVGTANIIKGLEAGADEFLSKPFNMAELRSRLSAGARIIGYEKQLADSENTSVASGTELETLLTTISNKNGGKLQIENRQENGTRYILDIPPQKNNNV